MTTRVKPPFALLFCAIAILLAGSAWGDVGPENVAVIVNEDSWASMTVANEFVHLRGVPPANIIYLKDLPDFEQTDVETFREKILKPVIGTLVARGIAAQVSCIAYSSDLPFRINVSADMKDRKFPKVITPWAAINGLTYLNNYVLHKDPSYLDLRVNRYGRRPEPELNAEPVREQDSEDYAAAMNLLMDKKWDEAAIALRAIAGDNPDAPDLLYNLSCALGRIGEPDEAMRALRHAVDTGFLSHTTMATDKDLEILWERQDFKDLIEEMKGRVFDVQPTRGFSATRHWSPDGQPGAGGGTNYMLSTMLAVTSGRGNSVTQALAALRRSVAADGTRPTGTIYYMVNQDIRSTTRQWGFGAAVGMLEACGVSAEAIGGVIPTGKTDVQGLMAGSPFFRWNESKSEIQPGAICEHLTSTGGVLVEKGDQTPLTDFIKYGAAIASGTVVEPYAIKEKFPDPFVHVHYARGCTAVEALYQSVMGPYQLLIVGDPLCSPWASRPELTVEGIEPNATLKGRVSITPVVQPECKTPVDEFELYVDGRRHAVARPGEPLYLNTRGVPDGYHELRVVAILANAIETRGGLTLPVRVDNRGLKIEVSGLPTEPVPFGQSLRLTAKLPGAGVIFIAHNGRPVGSISGESGEVEIDTSRLGLGAVRLQAVGAIGKPGDNTKVAGDPLQIEVVAPAPLPALTAPADAQWVEGLKLSPEGAEPVVITDTHANDWLEKAGVKPDQAFVLTGHFEVPADDMYQFQGRTDCEVEMQVDAETRFSLSGDKWIMQPVSLAKGMHSITVKATAKGKLRLQLRFGGPGALSVGAPRFRHTGGQTG